MRTAIPKTADLAAALVAHAGANADTSLLLAGLICDEASRANAAGSPRPMLDFVTDAKAAFPMMFACTAKAAESLAVPANEPLIVRVAREAREAQEAEVRGDFIDPWASAPMTARAAKAGNNAGFDPDIMAAVVRARSSVRPLDG